MNESPRISIIIPVYNTENFLQQCIESVIAQTYANLEIILIDDGSSDKSSQICDEYAEKDNRIIVVHKENEGVSKARNEALKLVTGTYVGFVDSDDTIHPNMFESLYNNLIQNNVDISICDFEMVYSNKTVHKNPKDILMKLDSSEAIKNILLGKYFQGHLCNKLFKASVIKDLWFDEDIYVYEDLLFVIRSLLNSSSVFFDSTPYYSYNIRENSAFHSEFTYKRYTAHIACERVLNDIKKSDFENNEDIIMCVQAAILICNTVFLQKLYYDKAARNQFCKPVRNNIKNSFGLKIIRKLSILQQMGVVLARISTTLFFLFVPIKERFM